MSKVLHEYRDKNNDLVRVRQSSSGEVYIDQYDGNERVSEDHSRLTTRISGGDGRPEGHGRNHEPLEYDDNE